MFTNHFSRTIVIGRACLIGLLGLLSGHSEAPPKFNPPKTYYLALGDSIAYGYQAFKARAGLPPSAFNTGYVDVFAAHLREISRGIRTVNYGCPGESTESFFNGPCIWTETGHQLHDTFRGSQLQAAITFLRAYRGEVSPITLTLGTNDQPKLLGPCTSNGQIDLACVQNGAPAFIAGLAQRLSSILDQLRSAAPDAEIILTGVWDPYFDLLPFTDPLFQAFNASMAQAAAARRVRYADPFPIFNLQGDLTTEMKTLCMLTLFCADHDSHPSDAGCRALASLVFEVSGTAGLMSGKAKAAVKKST